MWHVQAIVQSLTPPPWATAPSQAILNTVLRRERQPLGIDRPDLGMLQDLAQVHEMPLRGRSRGTAGASPDANGRLDHRIPTDSRLSILPDAGKLGQMGKICHILPVGGGRIVTMSAMSEEAYQNRGGSRIRGRQRIDEIPEKPSQHGKPAI